MNNKNCGIPKEKRPYLLIKEAAKELCLTYQTMYKACKAGDFDTVKIGRRYLVPKATVQKFLTEKFKATAQ